MSVRYPNSALRYFVVYKPFGMLSQFTNEGTEHATLADLGPLPPDVYAVGRLDSDSEGLLILTNDNRLNKKLLDPKFGHQRTYLAQVEGLLTPEAIDQLQRSVIINVNGKKYKTLPAKARVCEQPHWITERIPPIRYRKSVPDSWLELSLTEGKNRQVRKMTAAVGFPTLRLIRIAIGKLTLEDMHPCQVIEFTQMDLEQRLFAR